MKQVLLAVVILLIAVIAVFFLSRDHEEIPVAGDEGSTTETGAETVDTETVDTVGTGQPGEDPEGPELVFDIVRVEASGEAVMAGRAPPGARVTVMSRSGAVAEVVADARGEWVVVLDEPLAPGDHEFWLVAETDDGESMESGDVVLVLVPESDASGEVSDTEVVAVITERDGDGAFEVVPGTGDGVGISGGGGLRLDGVSYDEAGNVTLSGRATPGSTILLYVDGRIAGQAGAEENGTWQLRVAESLEEGTYGLRIDEVGAGGSVVARLETPFVRASYTMPSTSENLVVIQPGNNLWVIARKTYGRGVLYSLIFEANHNQIANPDLIYPGQIFVLPPATAPEG